MVSVPWSPAGNHQLFAALEVATKPRRPPNASWPNLAEAFF
jgi:hypothetical protein